MYDAVLNAVINMAEMAEPYAQIVIGSMPPDNGIAMIGDGGVVTTYRNMDADYELTIICNGKHHDQLTLASTLSKIHRLLTFRKDFPTGDDWQIYSIQSISAPRLIGREKNNQWLYGSSLRVKFYMKGLRQ